MSCERKTIMIVDDNPAILEMGKAMMKNDYRVYPVLSSKIMFELLEKVMPDLILLDVEMPEMNGYEAIKILKSTSKWAQIPVIFLTSRADEESEFEGLGLGAADYVIKPFFKQILRKRIDNQIFAESQKKILQEYNDGLSEIIREKTEGLMKLQNALLSTMTDLVEFRDDITIGHVNRVAKYTDLLLESMMKEGVYSDEISSWDRQSFVSSTKLHDIGKIAVSDAILNKGGKLTDEEFNIMKSHVNIGLRVIRKVQTITEECPFLEYARLVVGAHHERWDGKGYPAGLKGTEIPLEGRLMAIADVYDALISKRPYKQACGFEEARSIIKNSSGTQFDPALICVFSQVSDQFAEIVRQYTY